MIPRHSMKAVSRQTGLSPHLIRMWERRYQAVLPDRSSTGRRLYSDDDIARLNLLRIATGKGETIGQVAQLSTSELTQMLGRRVTELPTGSLTKTDRTPAHYLEDCLGATLALDSTALESHLLEASALLTQQVFLDEVLMSFLETTGELWERGDLKIAQEHLASAVVRSLLGSMTMSRSVDDRGPLLLTTTPSGQRHEFGALVAAVVANSMGWHTLHLGPDMPAEEIASVATDKRARAVALSLVYPADDPRLVLELRNLRRVLPEGIALIVGGRAAEGYRTVLDEIEARLVNTLSDFQHALSALRSLSPGGQ